MTGRLSQPDIPGNSGLKDQAAVETPQIGSDGGCEVSPLVIHRQQQPFDSQMRVYDPAQMREGIE